MADRPTPQYVPLHLHSDFSLADGAIQFDALFKRLKDLGINACALTDHGALHGAHEFFVAAKEAGVKPILGMEAYVSPTRRDDETQENAYKLILLVQDEAGYRNLSRLASIASIQGFHHGRPHIDREVLEKHAEGLIVLTSGLEGELAQTILNKDREAAREMLDWYSSRFPDRFYLEVQAHHGPGQKEVNEMVLQIGAKRGLPVVATTDAHFLTAADHGVHETRCRIVPKSINSSASTVGDDFQFQDPHKYVKSPEEMLEFFPDHPEVLQNTVRVADSVRLDFGREYHVPQAPIPEGETSEAEYLEKLVYERAFARYGTPLPARIDARLQHELSVIREKGFPGYFLIVQDLVNWAKERDIPVGPGRGSAAGSLVAYTLDITTLDPIKNNLLFERFLSPDRVTMPDIDIDFCPDRRNEVIQYLRDRYGAGSVSQIVTFNRLQARAVVDSVCKRYGMSPEEINALKKEIPEDGTLSDAIRSSDTFAKFMRSRDERTQQIARDLRALEGAVSNLSIHPSGTVIAPGKITDFVPVCTPASKRDSGEIATQFAGESVEKMGLLKVDLLNVSFYSIIEDCRRLVKDNRGIHISFGEQGVTETLSDGSNRFVSVDDDPLTYRTLCEGGTEGVFQLAGNGATQLLSRTRVSCFNDLVAVLALNRPGPLKAKMDSVFIQRKHGETFEYPHPDLEPILQDTYGVFLYQEQLMLTAQKLARFTPAEADELRKAVAKKNDEATRTVMEKFVKQAIEAGYDEPMVRELARQMGEFGEYGFNKSHSAAYAVTTYMTAYLRAHYPAEFLTAMLQRKKKIREIAPLLGLARQMGIKVLPPDVNKSHASFSLDYEDEKPSIRVGLSSISKVNEGIAHSIIAEREERGLYDGYYEFIERNEPAGLTKGHLEALAGAGAFDRFGERAQFFAAAESSLTFARKANKKKKDKANFDIFEQKVYRKGAVIPDPSFVLPTVEPMSQEDRILHEAKYLGTFVSAHPLDGRHELSRALRSHSVESLHSLWDAETTDGESHLPDKARLVGTLVRLEKAKGGKGGERHIAEIDDGTGIITATIYQKAFEQHKDLLQVGRVLELFGPVERPWHNDPEKPVQFKIWEATVPSAVVNVRLRGSAEEMGKNLRKVAEIVLGNPGDTPVRVYREGSNEPRVGDNSIDPTADVLAKLRDVLGDRNVSISRLPPARKQSIESSSRKKSEAKVGD